VLLGGCATEISRPACPALIRYPAATQSLVAAELAAAPAGAAWPAMIEDYGDLRARCRAIAVAAGRE
jgi:hypothetical protein